MKSKRFIYFFTIFSILYFLAFFQSAFAQVPSHCPKQPFKSLKILNEIGVVPETLDTWHVISTDTVLIFGKKEVYIFHNLRSESPKFFKSALRTKFDSVRYEYWTCTGVGFLNSKLGFVSAWQYSDFQDPGVPNTYREGLFKTIDGGLNWTKSEDGSGFEGRSRQVIQVRKNILYIFSLGKIIQSTDEGKTWTEIGSTSNTLGNQLHSFYFIDDSTIIAGGIGVLGKSIDGGKTWKVTHKFDRTKGIGSIIFLGNKMGYATCKREDFNSKYTSFQTEDGGETWHETNFGLPETQKTNLNYLFKVNDSTAFATGEHFKDNYYRWEPDGLTQSLGFLLKTVNAGKSWETYYGCPRPFGGDTANPSPYRPLFVWASNKQDSLVYVYSRGIIFYSGGLAYNSIDDNQNMNSIPKLRLYPNPIVNYFTIESEEGIKTVSMYDPLGRRVLFKESSLEHAMKLDLQELPRGIYLLQVETDGGRVTQRVVVE